MESFTGPELGALIEEGSMIGAHEVFTGELRRQCDAADPFVRLHSNMHHWAGGAYLITRVSEQPREMHVGVTEEETHEVLQQRLDDDFAILLQDDRFVLAEG